jgi:recombination protein RecR
MSFLPQNILDLIDEFSSLPGIGPKSAARIVFFLQKAPNELSLDLAEKLKQAKISTKICQNCYNLSEAELCVICQNEGRNEDQILVVEDSLDLIAIEKTGIFRGLYHVLGGIISPMNGVGPDEIRIKELLKRLEQIAKKKEGVFTELIIATNPNMEGEATALYIQKEIENNRLLSKRVKVTRLARGLATGADIDYIDDLTIKKAIEGRAEM